MTSGTRRVTCPVCHSRSVEFDLTAGRHVRCRNCDAELLIKFKYYILYVLISVLGALLVARLQGLEGPIFVGGALLYAVVFLAAGFFVVVRVFPVKVEPDDKHRITKLKL